MLSYQEISLYIQAQNSLFLAIDEFYNDVLGIPGIEELMQRDKLFVHINMLQGILSSELNTYFPKNELNILFNQIEKMLQSDLEHSEIEQLRVLFSTYLELIGVIAPKFQTEVILHLKKMELLLKTVSEPHVFGQLAIELKNAMVFLNEPIASTVTRMIPEDIVVHNAQQILQKCLSVTSKRLASVEDDESDSCDALCNRLWEKLSSGRLKTTDSDCGIICNSIAEYLGFADEASVEEIMPLLLIFIKNGLYVEFIKSLVDVNSNLKRSYYRRMCLMYFNLIVLAIKRLPFHEVQYLIDLNFIGVKALSWEYISYRKLRNDLQYFFSNEDEQKELKLESLSNAAILARAYGIKLRSMQSSRMGESSVIGIDSHGDDQFVTLMFPERTDLNEFMKFVEKLKRINANAREQHTRDVDLFLILYQPVIVQLVYIMNNEAFTWMSHFLSNTVLPLERLLNTLSLLPSKLVNFFTNLFSENQRFFMSHEGSKTWQRLLIVSHLIEYMASKNDKTVVPERQVKLYMEDSKHVTDDPNNFLRAMGHELVSLVLVHLEIDQKRDSEIEVEDILSRIDSEYLSELLIAKDRMTDDEYRDIFIEMLKRDIIGDSVSTFCHDTEQESALGRNLAEHNQKVRERLESSGVDVNLALNFSETYEFICDSEQTESDTNEIDISREVLWSYLLNFNRVLESEILHESMIEQKTNKISKVKIHIKQLINMVGDDDKSVGIILKTDLASTLLRKINTNLMNLLNDAKNASAFSISFYEFAEHYISQFALITESSDAPVSRKNKRGRGKKYFRIQQWSKDDPRTFALGDYVGCCLATTSPQFPAIVQRRMDDAMLFHVIVDIETNKPVALSWLYLAEGYNNEIYLVVNFMEIHARYGCDRNIRNAMMNALLYFSGEIYCSANPAIKGLLMNELTYGWHAGGLNAHALENSVISNKVGGPFVPGESNEVFSSPPSQERVTTEQHYYLTSLSSIQLHRYEAQNISEQERSMFLSIQTIFDRVVLEQAQKAKRNSSRVTFLDIKTSVVDTLSVLVGNFFGNDTSLLHNKRFAKMLQMAICKNQPLFNDPVQYPCSWFRKSQQPEDNPREQPLIDDATSEESDPVTTASVSL